MVNERGEKMSNKIYWLEPNGDIFTERWYAYCAICGEEVLDMYPSIDNENGDTICIDCAYIHGYITEKEYLENVCLGDPYATRAVIHDGEVYIADNSKLPWEKTAKDHRNSPRYKEWRTAVFERDGYKCAICGQVGGELNAHHIKPFSEFEESRFDVDNGITFCKKCHKQVHREKNNEWLHTRKQNNSK